MNGDRRIVSEMITSAGGAVAGAAAYLAYPLAGVHLPKLLPVAIGLGISLAVIAAAGYVVHRRRVAS